MPRLSLRRRDLLILLLALVAGMPSRAAGVPQQINTETAERLAAEAYNWPKSYVWYDRRDHSFLVFAPMGGEYGTAPITWLAVNPWTGDVWDVWNCQKLSTALLRKSQAAIRRSFRLRELRQYARLRALRPACYGP